MIKDCEIELGSGKVGLQGAHIGSTGSKCVRPDIEEPSKSMFSPGTNVEVSSMIDKSETVWIPAMIIREVEEEEEEENDKKKFIVKECNKNLNTTIDPSRVRPAPPASLVKKDLKLLDCIEVFRGSSWRQGSVTAILSEYRYIVRFGPNKEESVFKDSELRPLMEWEDGIWFKVSVKVTSH